MSALAQRSLRAPKWAYGTMWRELVATIAEAIAKAKEGANHA